MGWALLTTAGFTLLLFLVWAAIGYDGEKSKGDSKGAIIAIVCVTVVMVVAMFMFIPNKFV